MKKTMAVVLSATLIVLSGCVTRSISDSGYDASSGRYARSNAFYHGELTEFDVLGIDRGAKPSDEEISKALATRQPVTVKRGSSIMLIQSGALVPDDPMTKALEKYYAVGGFSGVPNSSTSGTPGGVSAESYARSLRLAAARGGYEKVIVYWGLLESARENLATTTVSWVPVVGWVLPDERQRMRIRLKAAVIDVRTGQWDIFSPEPLDDRSFSSILSRKETDQALVGTLKEKAYVSLAEELVRRYGQ